MNVTESFLFSPLFPDSTPSSQFERIDEDFTHEPDTRHPMHGVYSVKTFDRVNDTAFHSKGLVLRQKIIHSNDQFPWKGTQQ